MVAPPKEIVNVVTPLTVSTVPAVDGALDAQSAAGLAAVARADLVDVAVVVDRRAQELGDDHPAGDEHECQHDERRPPPAAARRRRRARLLPGAEVELSHVTAVRVGIYVQGLASSGSCAVVRRARRSTDQA